MEQVLFKNRKADRALTFKEYCDQGGYEALKRSIEKISPDEIISIVKDSGIRGRGGAGFPTGVKWSFIPKDHKGEKYILCNCDEMEPGTYKDRVLIETSPHLLVEGIILAAYAISAKESYIFIRREYAHAALLLDNAIREAHAAGFLGTHVLGSSFSTGIKIHRSAGRYICGEETALLNSLEGKRANPRARPPFPAVKGLRQSPTAVNNVETLANIPGIVLNGAQWFKDLALTPEDAGTKLFCISGKVNRPECFELPLGITLRDLLNEYCGGMKGGKRFKACIPGGASTAYLSSDHIDLPLDFIAVEKAGSRLGTGAVVFFDEDSCLVGATLNLINFFARESCGWCTPCRDGLPLVKYLLTRIEEGKGKMEYIEILRDHVRLLNHAFCAFAPGAMGPLDGLLKLFEDEIKEHIQQGRCPFI